MSSPSIVSYKVVKRSFTERAPFKGRIPRFCRGFSVYTVWVKFRFFPVKAGATYSDDWAFKGSSDAFVPIPLITTQLHHRSVSSAHAWNRLALRWGVWPHCSGRDPILMKHTHTRTWRQIWTAAMLKCLPSIYKTGVHSSPSLVHIISQINPVYTPHPISLRPISILSSHQYLSVRVSCPNPKCTSC
jgi:hypothetical protein